MGKLFCLIGKSSSGKDSIYEKLKEDKELNLTCLVSYTTRPIRANEIDGLTYYYVDNAFYEKMKAENKIIESRTYDTVYGPWHYFTADDGQIDFDRGNFIAIETLESYHQIRKYYGESCIVPVYVEVEDGERLMRAISREKKQDLPKYEEMCRRFLGDCKDFSEEKILAEGITKRYQNIDFDECCREIKKDILDIMNSIA